MIDNYFINIILKNFYFDCGITSSNILLYFSLYNVLYFFSSFSSDSNLEIKFVLISLFFCLFLLFIFFIFSTLIKLFLLLLLEIFSLLSDS